MLIHFKAQWFQQFPNVEIFCLRKVQFFVRLACKYFKINQTRVLAINIFFRSRSECNFDVHIFVFKIS